MPSTRFNLLRVFVVVALVAIHPRLNVGPVLTRVTLLLCCVFENPLRWRGDDRRGMTRLVCAKDYIPGPLHCTSHCVAEMPPTLCWKMQTFAAWQLLLEPHLLATGVRVIVFHRSDDTLYVLVEGRF